MSDHNQNDKRDTKTKLLGELESIKALLDEDDWGDIPILSDSVTLPAGVTPPDRITAPAPHQTPPSARQMPPPAHRTSTDIEAAVERLNLDLDLSEEDSFSADEEDDSSAAFEHRDKPGHSDATHYRDATHTSEDDNGSEADELPTLTETMSVDPEDEEPTADEPESDAELVAEKTPARAPEALPPIYDPPISEHEEFDDWPTATVLPGQQSLFEPAPGLDSEPDRDLEPEWEPDRGEEDLAGLDSISPEQPEPTAENHNPRPNLRTLKKGTGENPFLPKHIRERLHTHKTLVDIIKETPLPFPKSARSLTEQLHQQVREQLPTAVPPERLQALVDEVLALYLPRIEAELRKRLLAELKPADPPDSEQ